MNYPLDGDSLYCPVFQMQTTIMTLIMVVYASGSSMIMSRIVIIRSELASEVDLAEEIVKELKANSGI